MPTNINNLPTLATLWLARGLALLLCLFWGAFFVEHLGEWFLNQSHALPPLRVWIGQLLHLVMILGLGLILFRPGLGAVVTIVGTAAFFSWIGYRGFPYIALLNLPPILFALASWALRRHQKPQSPAPPVIS